MARLGLSASWTPELASRICAELADGRSLRQIAKQEDWCPSRSEVMLWLSRDRDFADQYARAREMGQDALIEEALEIVDAATPETVHVAKLKADQRKWQASKIASRRYGDKLDLTANINSAPADPEELKARVIDKCERLGLPIPDFKAMGL